jgi:5-methylcytosine-specific restriction endonuclease McrA
MANSKSTLTSIIVPQKIETPRSKQWPRVRKAQLKRQPFCQACGKNVKLAVHHIVPLHVDRSLELDINNLITLCENVHSSFCHYTFGHLGISWWKWDVNVIEDAATHLKAIQEAANQPIRIYKKSK